MLERQGGRYVYNSQKRRTSHVRPRTHRGATGAETAFSFTPTYSGEYEVRVARPGAATYVAQPLLRLRLRRHPEPIPSR
ncbi:MAG: hypothetical protein WKG07_27570 [Hymenobacter sp.]